MVTQLLFGDSYTVTESTESWLKIITTFDNYECWINIKQYHKISEKTFKELQKQESYYCNELTGNILDKLQEINFPITIGAQLPFLKDNKISFEDLVYGYSSGSTKALTKSSAIEIIKTAMIFINSPYLWGGKSPFGIDCSGFTQLVYKINGYKLPRDASQQVEIGTPLNFVEEADAGDIAFFDNDEGAIVHVGILLDKERIIHASGKVRIDKFDHYGIHNVDTKKYSHTLRVIKRLIC